MRNVGCVYHRKVLFNQEPNHIYRVRESYNGCFLSRRCSMYSCWSVRSTDQQHRERLTAHLDINNIDRDD